MPARSNTGACHEKKTESAMSADRSIINRCGNGRVVSTDHETPGQERSSSCWRTRSNRRRYVSSCRKGGWRASQKNLIGKGMPTQACVDGEGCSGSGAPAISPSVEKETTLRQVTRITHHVCERRRWTKQHLSAVAMNVLANGHNSEQVSKRVRCAGSLQIIVWVVEAGRDSATSRRRQASNLKHVPGIKTRRIEDTEDGDHDCCHGWSDNVMCLGKSDRS